MNDEQPSFGLPEIDDHEVASATEEKELEWLIQERIARSVITLVAGRPGQGKSLFSAWLAAHVSQQGHGVLFSNLEDLRGAVTRPRLRVAEADLDLVHFWTPDLTHAEGLATLEAVVHALGIRLLIIDPLSAHLPRRVMDDRAAIAPLQKLCERTGLAIVALHHTKKSVSKNAHPLDAVKGAGDGFMANARFVYLFGRNVEDEDVRVLAGAKTNVAELGSMTFGFEMVGTQVNGNDAEIPRLVLEDPLAEVPAHNVLAHGTDGGKTVDPTKNAVAVEWLTSLLMFGELHADEIKKAGEDVGISWRTARRAAEKAGVVRRESHRGFGKGREYWWRLPDGHAALQVGAVAKKAAEIGQIDLGGSLTVEQVLAAIDAHGTVSEPEEGEEQEGSDG